MRAKPSMDAVRRRWDLEAGQTITPTPRLRGLSSEPRPTEVNRFHWTDHPGFGLDDDVEGGETPEQVDARVARALARR